MKIGKLEFKSDLVQGPLAGYSCAPLRRLAWKWGGLAFSFTEMLSSKNMTTKPKLRARYIHKDPEEGPLCFQLSGNRESDLVEAVKRSEGFGADLIDLNCGCPKSKIRRKGMGSQLLSTPSHLHKLVGAMRGATDLPLLVKMRTDGKSCDGYSLLAARAIEEAGADALTAHGRHWTEKYDVPCSLDEIAEVVEAVSIPVIGNGDAVDAPSVEKMKKHTGCQGVMIARAGVGQPWLFAKIQRERAGEVFQSPTLKEAGDIFLDHVRGLMDLVGEERGIFQSRKLAKYYHRPDPLTAEAFIELHQGYSFRDLEKWTRRWFV